MQNIRIIGFFFEKTFHWQFEAGLLKIYSTYLGANLSTTPDLKFYKPQHSAVFDSITRNFKAS
jgi:hypothetical protein